MSNDTLINALRVLVARELNSIKTVHHPIYVCQFDLMYLTINLHFNCWLTSLTAVLQVVLLIVYNTIFREHDFM